MKKLNKMLSIILSVIMILSIIPLTANAATYSGTCGDNLEWIVDSDTGILTISGSGEMDNYKKTGYYGTANMPWGPVSLLFTKVVIEEGVTSIGDYAFYYCKSLQSVEIPDSVTTIGARAFYCTSLQSIEIPHSVTSIGEGAFSWCDLMSITIPDSIVTINRSVFSHCSNLTSIVIPNSVISIGDYAFYECASLTNLIIPDNVELIGKYAFSYCDNLTTVTIGDGTKSIGDYAFYNCDNLTTVTIGDGTISIGNYAFRECDKLSTVYLRDNIISDIPDSFPVWDPIQIYYSGTEEQWKPIYGEPFLPRAKVYFNYHVHKWDYETVEPTCTTHGYEKQTCRYHTDSTCDYKAVTTYTANPTGHSFNEDGVCEVCGEKEVSTNHINNQMLTIESVLAMVLSFLSKLFGIFSV